MPDTEAPKAAPRAAAKPEEPKQFVEVVNMGGLVMRKTVDLDSGDCKTEVLKQPMMSAEEIRATRTLQKMRGGR